MLGIFVELIVLIYMSGSISQTERLRLACIRMLLCGHTPICPILMCKGFFNDDRLRKSREWFEKIVQDSMKNCKVFVYLTEPCGCWQTKIERSLVPKNISMVPFDIIQEWLWKYAARKTR